MFKFLNSDPVAKNKFAEIPHKGTKIQRRLITVITETDLGCSRESDGFYGAVHRRCSCNSCFIRKSLTADYRTM